MERLIIKGGTVIPVTGREHIYPNGIVLIEDGNIVYAGPTAGAPLRSPRSRCV
jgi:imidazolonepropionase-like amidohydrolase